MGVGKNEMIYEEACAYIERIPKFTQKNGLPHTEEFLKRLGGTGKEQKIIHVAGTNGKGSVCAYLMALLMAEKRTMGLFSSPHLQTINERIIINGTPISNEEFSKTFEEVLVVAKAMEEEGAHPSYFEFLLGMAMLAFTKAQVEYMIIETGIGGRLDATNVFSTPVLTLITSISPDHKEILGNTIEEIATEKAGIIKKNVPVIFDGNEKRSKKVLEAQAKAMYAPYTSTTRADYKILENTNNYIAFSSKNAYYEEVIWQLNTRAYYQIDNAMLALEAMQYLFGSNKHLLLWKEAIRKSLWEGRMEEVAHGVYIDGAHNLGGIKAFVESANDIAIEKNGKIVVLFSVVKDKEYEKMIAYLCKHLKVDYYVLTTLGNERGTNGEDLVEVFEKYTNSEIKLVNDIREAWEIAVKKRGESGNIYCLGSLYLVGILKDILKGGYKNA